MRGRGGAAATAAVAGALVLLAACSVTHDHATGPVTPAPTTVTTTTPTSAPTSTPAPPSRNVLTGEPGATGRIVAVKIDNVRPARPATGLNSADLVYGIEVEGGLSRIMAVFDSHHIPATVGPVRSARETDLQLLSQYDKPVLAFSGAQSHLLPVLKADRNIAAVTDTGAFFRSADRSAPHNEYLHTHGLALRAGQAKDIGLRFSAAPPPGGTPGSFASASMPSARFSFTWNGSQYRVAMDGTRSPWTADNVIIQHVRIRESRFHSRTGFVPFTRTVGGGAAQILRGGKSYAARWSRPTPGAGTTYTLPGGGPATLRPGRTWIILEP